MPKFEMKVMEPARLLEDGTYKKARTFLVPVNDAAMVSTRAKEALAVGAWIPAEKDAIKKAAERLAEAHASADVRRGACLPDEKDDRKAKLLKNLYKV